MKLLFVGSATNWDALAAALGYLNQPFEGNPYFGDANMEPGHALLVGYDDQNREVYALGAMNPSLVQKITRELIKVGYPQSSMVEVIALNNPYAKKLLRLLKLCHWPLVGRLVQQYTNSWVRNRMINWWEEGRSIRVKMCAAK